MSKEIVYSKNAPEPIGPYSQGVKVGNVLYTSGQIALDADTGELFNENITEETHAVMKNLDAVLSAAFFSFNDVVKCTIFIRDMDDFPAINEAYGQYFKSSPPARETVEVARLPKNVNVEISCIAVKG
jgi:2-iminobutanoate/2-iminopropanoate deaminase